MLDNDIQKSEQRFRADLRRSWSAALCLIFGIMVLTFVLWFVPLAVDLRALFLSFILINCLHAFNLYLIVRDGDKSLQWMTAQTYTSTHMALQEILNLDKSSVSGVVYFGLNSIISLAAAIYYICLGYYFIASVWICFTVIGLLKVASSISDLLWSRFAYDYWMAGDLDEKYDAVQKNDIKSVD